MGTQRKTSHAEAQTLPPSTAQKTREYIVTASAAKFTIKAGKNLKKKISTRFFGGEFESYKLLYFGICSHDFVKAGVELVVGGLAQILRELLKHGALAILEDALFDHVASALEILGEEVVDVVPGEVRQEHVHERRDDESDCDETEAEQRQLDLLIALREDEEVERDHRHHHGVVPAVSERPPEFEHRGDGAAEKCADEEKILLIRSHVVAEHVHRQSQQRRQPSPQRPVQPYKPNIPQNPHSGIRNTRSSNENSFLTFAER
jgi:hypothetical protein